MSQKTPTNVAASVRQRLLNLSKNAGRPFAELLQFYAMERFLHRLSVSPHRNKLILKGALMMTVWHSPVSRPTLDIDFLGKLSSDERVAEAIVREICAMQVDDDGITFDPRTILVEFITEDADYKGLRVRFKGTIDRAQVSMQLDIGFGDILIPSPKEIKYPTLLDHPKPSLIGYTMESLIAEKAEAMVKLGIANSRAKDFYDVWLLSRQFEFDGVILTQAIRETFNNRGTRIATPLMFLSQEFSENRQKQSLWSAYTTRNHLNNAPTTISETLDGIRIFLLPVLVALAEGSSFGMKWNPAIGWIE